MGARLPDPAARQRHDEPGPQVGTSRALSRLPRSGPGAQAGVPQGRAAPGREVLAECGVCQAVAGPGYPGLQPVTADPFGGAGGGSGPSVCREREGSGASGLGRFAPALPDVPSKGL